MAIQGTAQLHSMHLQTQGMQNLPAPQNDDLWNRLKRQLQGDMGVFNVMQSIERNYRPSRRDISIEEKSQDLFALLMKTLSPDCRLHKLSVDKEKPNETALRLQMMRNQSADASLPVIWHKENLGLLKQVQAQGVFLGHPLTHGASEVKDWLRGQDAKLYLAKITKLDLSNLSMSEVPEAISHCKGLKDLNLCNNQFASFPYDVNTWWPQLERLNLSNNSIGFFLDAWIPHLSLTTLDLSSNDLRTFSYDFNKFPKLNQLYLHNNSFRELSCVLTQCSQLRFFSLTTSEVHRFSFKLPLRCSLSIGSVWSLPILECNFSFPGVRAFVSMDLMPGLSLGVVTDISERGDNSEGRFFSFIETEGSWNGIVPLSKDFFFALRDPKRTMIPGEGVISEAREEWRRVDLSSVWNGGVGVVDFQDIEFRWD